MTAYVIGILLNAICDRMSLKIKLEYIQQIIIKRLVPLKAI
jgi:hypothetical protein